ncbi:hypothetical protein IWX49DRAFT_170237 [Phyllosticta citricarpa]|uniref:Uncharacterized protein n=1 Tax=Phyllosticta paracitricarpa TaxID=2016321 RepID=A0ABR1N7D6_9PEZI
MYTCMLGRRMNVVAEGGDNKEGGRVPGSIKAVLRIRFSFLTGWLYRMPVEVRRLMEEATVALDGASSRRMHSDTITLISRLPRGRLDTRAIGSVSDSWPDGGVLRREAEDDFEQSHLVCLGGTSSWHASASDRPGQGTHVHVGGGLTPSGEARHGPSRRLPMSLSNARTTWDHGNHNSAMPLSSNCVTLRSLEMMLHKLHVLMHSHLRRISN